MKTNGLRCSFKFQWLLFIAFTATVTFCRAQTKDLDFYLENAKQSSPLLKDLQNQILINKLDSIRLRTAAGLQVAFNGNGSYAPIIKGYGYDVALSNGQTLSGLVGVNKNLISKSNFKTQLNSIGISSDSALNTIKISGLDLKKSIASQYITAYSSQQQLDFNTIVYKLLKEEDGILKKLTQNNVYKQTEYLTFFVSLQQQELQAKQSRITFLNDLSLLNFLSGITDTSAVKLAEPVLNQAVLTLFDQSVFGQKYRLDSLRLLNNRKLVDLSYQPKAGIYADAGYNSSLIDHPYKNFGTSIGFTLSVPIYDGHQRKLQYNKLNLAEQTRLAYRDFYRKQHKLQIDQLTQQLKETEALNSQIKEQIRYTKSLIEVNNRLLPTGDIRIADYILAVSNYLNAQNLLRQTNVNRLQIINELNYWNQ